MRHPLFAGLLCLLSLLIPFVNALAEGPPQDGAIERLQGEIDDLKQQIDRLNQKSENSNTPPQESENRDTPPEEVPEEQRSKIEYRESFTDQQEAAPRPYDLTIEPTYRGFIPIPHTHAMIRFNAKPRVDFINDNSYAGNENMFVTASIPVSGQQAKGGGYQFSMSAQGSRLSMDVRSPKTTGHPRFYYENDFSGTGNQYLNFRVRHLYGEMFNAVLGQNYTVFEDADAWPDTVDYEGPNAAISARRPLLKYMIPFDPRWVLSLSLERPNAQVDTSNDPTATSENHAPEGGLNIRWASEKRGHIQFGVILRDIGVSGNAVRDQNVLGWGFNLSAALNVFSRDSFQTQLTYGRGIFFFMNDSTENGDAAFNAEGDLKPLPVVALMGGYTHRWSDRLRSAASFGFVNLDNQTSQQWSAYHRTYYASANLIWQVYKRLCVGFEGLYGYKQVKSHASGQVFRGQASIMYSLF